MLVLLPIATLLTLLLTILIRKNALQKNQLDIPNERSSHTAPTPRGAGVAVATVFIVGLLALRVGYVQLIFLYSIFANQNRQQ